jgi:fatty acid amide hydrolase 2
MINVYLQPISQTVKLIQSGELSAHKLTRFIIERAKAVNPRLNAIVFDRFDQALKEAQEIDRRIANGEAHKLPLAGIPFSLKSNIALEGMPLDMGSWAYHGKKAPMTATIVKRLIDAGAIPIGVTNIAEMAMWHETVNDVYGRTLNPWSRWRTSGGSSGGEGAIVASGGALFGIGTDLSGSVRTPAAFCGLYGHKPTRGLIPLTGQWPYFDADSLSEMRNLDSIGPLARSAEDLQLLIEIMRGNCELDPQSHGMFDKSSYTLNWKDIRIGVMSNPVISKLSKTQTPIIEALRKAERIFRDHGSTIKTAPDDLFGDSYEIWRHMIHRATNGGMRKMFGGGKQRISIWEMAKFLVGYSDHRLASSFFMFTEEFLINKKTLAKLDQMIESANTRVSRFFDTHDLILMPTFPSPAPLHGRTLLTPHDAVIASPANVFGLPASAAPMGLSKSGLPIGVQILGKPGFDLMTIAAAALIGQYVPHPDLQTNDHGT